MSGAQTALPLGRATKVIFGGIATFILEQTVATEPLKSRPQPALSRLRRNLEKDMGATLTIPVSLANPPFLLHLYQFVFSCTQSGYTDFLLLRHATNFWSLVDTTTWCCIIAS